MRRSALCAECLDAKSRAERVQFYFMPPLLIMSFYLCHILYGFYAREARKADAHYVISYLLICLLTMFAHYISAFAARHIYIKFCHLYLPLV